jgi:phosphohistidine phosphatase SixA
VPPVAAAKFAEIPATKEILKQLRLGGFVLYLRHGNTDNSRPDRVPSVDLKDCSTQRPLTEAGRREARVVGEAMLQARIPIGEVRSSPLCRAKDTALAALPGQAFVIDDDLIYTANLTDVQKAPILANTKRLLSTPVAGGKNRLIIAHAPILMDLIGYFPKEVALVIFRPKGEAGFEYLASIPAAHWPELLR